MHCARISQRNRYMDEEWRSYVWEKTIRKYKDWDYLSLQFIDIIPYLITNFNYKFISSLGTSQKG